MKPHLPPPGRNPERFGQKISESTQLDAPFLPSIELIDREVGITSIQQRSQTLSGFNHKVPSGAFYPSFTLIFAALVVILSGFDEKNAESPQLDVPFLPSIELTDREIGITMNQRLSQTLSGFQPQSALQSILPHLGTHFHCPGRNPELF